MKKLFLLGLAIVLLTVSQNIQAQSWTKMSPEVDATKALVKDYQDGNWEKWKSHYADTAKVYHNSIVGVTPHELQENLMKDIQKLSSYGFSDKDIYYEMIIDDKGDKWVYFWGTWEGTVAATKKELVVPVHLALKFVNNKIVREYAYYDYSSLMTAFKEIEMLKASE